MKSIDDLEKEVLKLKKKGLNEKEISTELHLSAQTVTWLVSRGFKGGVPPKDIKIGWKSVGVYSYRISRFAEIMTDIILEELKLKNAEIDGVVGVAINGIPLATLIAEELNLELAIYRPHPSRQEGVFSSNFASIKNKKVVIIDDVLSTGETMGKTIDDVHSNGGTVVLALVLVNKTGNDAVNGVPLRSVVRARLLD